MNQNNFQQSPNQPNKPPQSNQPPLSQIPGPSAPSTDRRTCPPFDARRFEREFELDAFWRWGAIGLLLLLMVVFQMGLPMSDMWLMMLPVMAVWVAISMPSAKVVPLLPQINSWLDNDPVAAETAIATALARRPLHRHLRVQLYHHLALLRHYQMRLDESSAIAHALLTRRMGPAERYRPQLLLLIVEAKLLQYDLAGAYPALVELSKLKLSLIESLQHLSLRTRYEVAAGYDGPALVGLPGKIEMSQMMPANQCGTMHLLLAIAAKRQGDEPLHNWLCRRAELLCEPAQYEAFGRGQLHFAVERPLTLAAS